MASGPYFVPINPTSSEQSSYNRTPTHFRFTSGSFSWTWAFSSDYTPPGGDGWPPIRMLIDGVVVTAFVEPPTNSYLFSVTGVANGHHIIDFEGVPSPVKIIRKPFVVNNTGSPLPIIQQRPWTGYTRFEDLEDRLGPGVAQVTYPGDPISPPVFNLKARTIEPYATRLAPSALWTRRIQKNVYQSMVRRFMKDSGGDVVVEPDNRMFYSYPQTASGRPWLTMRDGARGKGSLGTLFTIHIQPDNSGCYWTDTAGRLGHLRISDGMVTTIAGWRLKDAELKVSLHYKDTAAIYDPSWENIGDWTLVNGTKQFNRTWSVAIKPDARIPNESREFWVTDKGNHRIIYANYYTAQTVGDYLAPAHPPTGYTAPGAPTGQTQLVTFLDRAKLATLGFTTPQQEKLLNEPFGITVNPAGTKIYWTNFGAGTVCRANMDGSSPEIMFECVYPTNAQLGISSPGGLGSNSTTLRTSYHLDGAAGVWKGSGRMQAIDFMSDGNPVWSERYTYAIRKGNLSDGSVSTVGLPSINGVSLEYDMIIAVDRDGTCGPVDDVFGAAHNNTTDFRYSAAGVAQAKPFTLNPAAAFTLNGPQNHSLPPGYAYGLGIGYGQIIFQGGASGWAIFDITKKLVGDPVPSATAWQQGLKAYEHGAVPPMALTHGPYGQGELGKPTVDEMGSWDDATLDAYALANGIPATLVGSVGGVAEFREFVRWTTIDFDYAIPPPPPPPPPPPGSRGPGRKVRPKTRLRFPVSVVSGSGHVGPGGSPLWRRDLPEGAWVKLPNASLYSIQTGAWDAPQLTHEPIELATPGPGGTPGFPSPNTDARLNYPFYDNVGAIFAAWCGASIDTRDSTVYSLAGGGHNDSYVNLAWKLKLSTDDPRFVEAAPPSPGTAVDAGGGDGPYGLNSRVYLDGRPASCHTGYCNQFIEARDRAMRFGSTSTGGHGGAHFPNITSLHRLGTDYEPDGTFTDTPLTMNVDDSICKHPSSEDVYQWAKGSGQTRRNTLARWNQASDTWTILSTTMPSLSVHATCIDGRRNRMFVLGGLYYSPDPALTGPLTVDLDTLVVTNRTLTGLSAASFQGEGLGMVFVQHPSDPDQDCFLVRKRAAGAAVYRINAVTFFAEVLTTTGGSTIPAAHFSPPSSSTSIYNRFLLVPQYGGVVYLARADSVWFLRLADAVTPSDVTGTAAVILPAPAVSAQGSQFVQTGDITIERRAINLSDALLFTTYHQTSRYERYQRLVVLSGTTVNVPWFRFNFTSGGTNLQITAGTYELVMDDAVVSTLTHPGGSTVGTFSLTLTPLADGWHKFEVRQVGAPLQSTVPWAMFINKAGGAAVAHSEIPVVAGSYDLTHGVDHIWAMLPNVFQPTAMPLPARECPVFSDAAAKATLYKTLVVPHRRDTNINRPSRLANGVTGTFNFQNYQWQELVRKYPSVHLLDGERGVGTVMMPTHLMVDRHGGAIFCDPWRVGRVSPTGKVSTRAGYRMSHPPRQYQESGLGQGLELVGDWSGIPVDRHGFHELWGAAFDLNSLALDPGAPQQLNSINGQMEHPHVIGPRLFVADSQNNRICLLTFTHDNFNAVPAVTEFLTGLADPWDCVWVDDVLYVSERQANRVNAYNATTGALIRTVIEGASGLAHVDASRFVRLDTTLAEIRAQPIILPEGLFYQDDWLYIGSKAMGQVKRINLLTDEIQLVCQPFIAGNSNFLKLAVSDGTFAPRGTVFTVTFTNSINHGMPDAFLPNTPGVNGTNSSKWNYFSTTGISGGKGGQWDAIAYGTSMGIGMGRMYCGSSEEGLHMVSKALPGDPAPNYTSYSAGRNLYKSRGYRLVYGDNGYGYQGLALPWGENADMDYYLEWNGHTPP